ncbi:MAG: hypothetical protein QW320_09775 [Ignisphaera sp.]
MSVVITRKEVAAGELRKRRWTVKRDAGASQKMYEAGISVVEEQLDIYNEIQALDTVVRNILDEYGIRGTDRVKFHNFLRKVAAEIRRSGRINRALLDAIFRFYIVKYNAERGRDREVFNRIYTLLLPYTVEAMAGAPGAAPAQPAGGGAITE